jgi:hypothetical protein
VVVKKATVNPFEKKEDAAPEQKSVTQPVKKINASPFGQ